MKRTTHIRALFLAIITVLVSTITYAAMVPTEQPTTATQDTTIDVIKQTVTAPVPQPTTTVATPTTPNTPEQAPQETPEAKTAAAPDAPITTPDAAYVNTNNIGQDAIDKAKQSEDDSAKELEQDLTLKKQKELEEQDVVRQVQEEKQKHAQEAKEREEHALLEKALLEQEAKEKAQQAAKVKAEKARLEQIEREKNKPVSGICAVSVSPRLTEISNNTTVAQANKLVIKKFSANDKRSTGWKPLPVGTIINLNVAFAKLGYEGFCKSPTALKSPLASLVLKRSNESIPSSYYRSFERLILDDVSKRGTRNDGLTYLSIGSGNLYEDFIILNKLLQRGKTIKKVILVDPTYQDLIGQLNPSNSQKMTSWKNHVAIAQLFTWFASAQKSVDFSIEIYGNTNSYRQDTSKTFPKATPDIMVHCCANNPEHPNIEKYDIQGAIGSYWFSPCMQLEGMREFVGVCVNHKTTDYGYLYNLKTNPTAKLSKMLKISKGETCLCNK